MTGADALRTETAYFESQRAKWVSEGHAGEWAVVFGASLVGFAASFDEAYGLGASRSHGKPFLVKQVKAADDVEVLQRVFA